MRGVDAGQVAAQAAANARLGKEAGIYATQSVLAPGPSAFSPELRQKLAAGLSPGRSYAAGPLPDLAGLSRPTIKDTTFLKDMPADFDYEFSIILIPR